jgi:hypothetical protein
MQLIDKKISLQDLAKMSEKMLNKLVKAVVDIEQGIMVVDAPLHADQEAFLLEHDSQQANLWGINLYPDKFGREDFIEFDSMINLRPSQGNRSRSVENIQIQEIIKKIVQRLVIA